MRETDQAVLKYSAGVSQIATQQLAKSGHGATSFAGRQVAVVRRHKERLL